VGGVAGVVYAGVMRSVGDIWGMAEVNKTCDEGATEGQAVWLPGVAIGPPMSILWAV
jgi:hypothetical protein